MSNKVEIKNLENWSEHRDDGADAFLWLKVAAYLSALIAILGILGITARAGFAADPAEQIRRFNSGSRTFTNPFANAQVVGDEEEDLENEEDLEDEEAETPFDRAGVPPRPRDSEPSRRNGARPSIPALNNNRSAAPPADPSKDVPDPVYGQQGIEVGGGQANEVIPGSPVSALNIDTETGAGSNEIITDFNYPDADIMDIAKTLGKLTGKNFIMDKDVRGRVTIISNSPITVGDAWRAFLTALDMNQFTLIPSGSYLRIARQRDARDKQINTYTGAYAPNTDQLITRLFPLQHISSEEVARTFRSFMPANSRIYPYEQTNTLIVTDTGANIAKLAKMLEFLDVEGFDAGIAVVPVKYASATELSKLIDTLLPGTTAGAGRGASRSRFSRRGGSDFTARRTKGGGIINAIIADERTNNLIVHANDPGVQQVRELIAKLDKKMPAQVGGGRLHVLYLQFADAEQVATTLNNLSSQTAARPSRTSTAGGGGVGVNPTQAALFEGAIKVSADKATNSLVVTASPSDFTTVQRVVAKLDIPRDEVYVEAVIMEMTLNRDYNFSANVVAPSVGIGFTPNEDLINFLANPIAQRGAILSFKTQGTTPITIGGETQEIPNLQGLIKAIQTNSNSNVLATPQILTLDNTEASFESGERIPVLTSTATNGAVASGVTRENIALSIKLKPQINKISNFVKLDIEAKMEDISTRQLPAQVQEQAFATIQRSINTSVPVASEDTVVLGGLIRDKTVETVSKVPLLGDIPLLGWLFKARTSEVVKTNLILFLTPHIVRQYEKVRAILDEKLRERDEFIEKNVGGEDPLRDYRDDLIRDLPDMKDVLSYQSSAATSVPATNPQAAEEAEEAVVSEEAVEEPVNDVVTEEVTEVAPEEVNP